MTFFKTNLYRLLKSKVRLLIILVLPLLFIVTFASMDYDTSLRLAVIDEDQTAFSRELSDRLAGNFRVISNVEEDVIASLIDSEIDYAVVIPSGFTREMIRGEGPKVRGYSISGTNMAVPVEAFINSFLDVAYDIAQAAGQNEKVFYQGMTAFSGGRTVLSFEPNNDINRNKSTMAMGFLVQFMLYMSVLTTGIIAEDKQSRTIHRIFSAPVSMKRYMTENLLSFILIAVLQVVTVMFFLKVGLDLYFGRSIWFMMVLFFFFAVVSIALGLVITSYSKSPVHAYVTIFLITSPLVMLGGSYWPRDFMPDILIKIGNFLPTSWVMSGVEKLLYGGNLSSIMQELLILTAFAGVFFLVGVMRKIDVAK